MKNPFVLLAFVVLITSSAGCSDKDSATPESVARALLASLQDGDSERYKKQCASREDLSEHLEAVIASGELEK